MSKPAAMQCDYVDLRFVKGRKVAQIVLEIPIEAGTAFVAAFGSPDPSKSCPVALAKMEPSVLRQQLEQSLEQTRPMQVLPDDWGALRAEALPPKKGGKLAQRAGILCSEGAFRGFVRDRFPECDHLEPAGFTRWYCNVNSRALLDHDDEAARKFLDLVAEYEAWKLAA